jgi:hypothetical protein
MRWLKHLLGVGTIACPIASGICFASGSWIFGTILALASVSLPAFRDVELSAE